MRVPRIFVDQPLTANSTIQLATETSHYLVRVLRLGAGSPVRLFNGEGGEFSGTIVAADKKRDAVVETGHFDPVNRSSPLRVHLGIVISRGERMDWVVQKATELGVSAITPLFSERCEVKLKGDRMAKKQAHWHRVAVSACEQSGLNLVPPIKPAVLLNEWLTTSADLKLLLHPSAGNTLTGIPAPRSVALLIGPEGGFSDIEIEQAQAAGFNGLQLGARVMRTETAPLAVLSILQFIWGDL